MTAFEVLRMACAPALPPLVWRVRRELCCLLRDQFPGGNDRVKLLDVGARRSPYTIGLGVDVTLLDVPRMTDHQRQCDLGVDTRILQRTTRRRSNVTQYRLEDFTANTLPNRAYQVVTAVEVIEHVQDDDTFVREAARVLTKDGFAFLTTPNGDDIPMPSPQHIRHYTLRQLRALCLKYFERVEVYPVLRRNRYWRTCHQPFNFSRPFRLAIVAGSNVLYKLSPAARDRGEGLCHHLFAVLRRPR